MYVERSSEVTYLGVIMDESLIWTSHVKYVAKKMSSAMGRLSSIKYMVSYKTKKMIYYALIMPNLNYCNVSWSATSETNINILQRALNRCCRAVLNIKDIRSSTLPLYKKLNLFPVKELSLFNLGKEMYRCLYGLNNYDIIFPPVQANIHNYPTRQGENFNLPQHNLTVASKAFCFRGPSLWNDIPPDIKKL